MKKYILFLFVLLTFDLVAQPTFDARIIVNERGYVEYQLMQTSGTNVPDATHKIGDITFEIRWLKSLGPDVDVHLVCLPNDYQLEEEALKRSSGVYYYRVFGTFLATDVIPPQAWQLNVWETIAWINIVNTANHIGTFELAPYGFGVQDINFTFDYNGNGNYLGEDYTPIITNAAVNNVLFPTILWEYIWTGGDLANYNDWNDVDNWNINDCGIATAPLTPPSLTSNCFIPGGVTNYPSTANWTTDGICNHLRIASEASVSVPSNINLTVNTDLTINAMTVTPGVLIINPDAEVDVDGMTYINGAQQIRLEADASGVGSFIDNGITYSSTGTAYVETYVVNGAPAGSYYAHLVGPTVTDQVFENDHSGAPGVYLIQFDLDYLGTYAYEWDENQATDGWLNVYPYGWSVYTGTGLLLSTIDASDYTMDMTGKLVTGDVTRSIGYGLNHLEIISNPYPSAIDWEVAYSANNAEVLSTYYIWNPSVVQYGTYNATTDLSTNGASKDIQVGQGFFVETQASASGFDFTNTQRLHSTQAFLKEEPANLLKIYASGFGTIDEINVCFMENATTDFDQLYDSKKWLSFFPEVTQIWTKSSDLVDLASNVLSPLTEEPRSIQMSVKLGFEGEYAISFENLSSFAAGTQIFLEDLKTGAEWVNVNENPLYTFTGSPEDDQARFVLHFFGPTGIGEDGMTSLVKIYSSKQYAYILNNSDESLREYVVYDMTGRPVTSGSLSNSTLNRIYVSDITGYYLVKVSSGENVYTAKVYISR